MSLLAAHRVWAWIAVGANGSAAVWALAAARWPSLGSRALWWFTGAAQAALGAEVVLGVALVAAGDRPVPDLHAFYGFLTLIAIALIYSYRQQVRHRLFLLYGLGGLFVTGLAVRAMVLRG